MPVNLSGNRAPSRHQRSATTPGAEIQFSTNIGRRRRNNHVPGLIVNARHLKGSTSETISLTSEQLSTITDLETLTTTVKGVFDQNRDYLQAVDTEGKNQALADASARKQAFFGTIGRSLRGTGLSREDYQTARRVLKGLEEETYMGHDIEFDTAKLDTYHPYGLPFDKGLRKLEALAPEGIERDNITDELNYITDQKTQYGWSSVNERNAEVTLRLRPIDRGNEGQTISLAKDSINPRKPVYVVLNVNADGLPEGTEEHAGKSVIRDGENLFFDKTNTPLPAELAEHLTEKSVTNKLGLRALETEEEARISFPYDWNRNKSIDVDKINTGWWGHCHIEAPLASWSVSAGSDVTVFDARSKAVKTFGETDVNDLLFAMLDATNYADIRTKQGANAGKTTFVGNRNDTRGGRLPGDKLIVEVNGRERPFSISIRKLFDPKEPENTIDANDSFSPTSITEGIQFGENPAFRSIRNTDWSTINGERKIVADIKYMDVSSSGSVERKSLEITLDPENPSEEPVLLGSQVGRGGYPPKVTKYYLNEVTGNLESRVFNPEKQEDGTWKMVATSEEANVIGSVSNRILSRELIKESIIELHNHVLNAARRGVSFVTEKSSGHSVWNYGTDGMRLNKVEQDGDFTKYEISLKTQGGTKRWEYILHYDKNGTPIGAHALDQPADFVWRSERSVSTPLFKGDNGRLLYNKSAYERGFLLDGNGKLSPEGMSFFRYASDVIYASLADTKKDERLVIINNEGELYFYDEVEAYKTDVTALGGDAEEVTQALKEDKDSGGFSFNGIDFDEVIEGAPFPLPEIIREPRTGGPLIGLEEGAEETPEATPATTGPGTTTESEAPTATEAEETPATETDPLPTLHRRRPPLGDGPGATETETTPVTEAEATPATAGATPVTEAEATPATAGATPVTEAEAAPATAEATPVTEAEATPATAEATPATAEATPATAEEAPVTHDMSVGTDD